jgi:hypothetical protein
MTTTECCNVIKIDGGRIQQVIIFVLLSLSAEAAFVQIVSQ